jgi:hypothetical protein
MAPMVRDRPMPAQPPQTDSRTTNEKGEVAMISIVAPAIDAELEYRRERITEDFRRARAPRHGQKARTRRLPRPRLTARAA